MSFIPIGVATDTLLCSGSGRTVLLPRNQSTKNSLDEPGKPSILLAQRTGLLAQRTGKPGSAPWQGWRSHGARRASRNETTAVDVDQVAVPGLDKGIVLKWRSQDSVSAVVLIHAR